MNTPKAGSLSTPQRATVTIRLPTMRPLQPFDVYQRSLFERRVQTFLRSLPASRRAEIVRRTRFHRLPWIRRADEPDHGDDFLP